MAGVTGAEKHSKMGREKMDQDINIPESSEQIPAEPEQKPKEISKDARMWAMFCHLLGLGWLIVWFIGGVLGALILWQLKKDEDPFIDEQGKEALNFQISMLIYWCAAIVLVFTCVGVVLMPAVLIVDLFFGIMAAIKANNGVHYRYPLTIRFVK